VPRTIASEEDLIRTYLAPLARAHAGASDLADDCAIFTPVPGTELIITTDAVAAGVHFFPDDAPEDIAWKALAVNVSDLAAKAAVPRVYQMALSFPDAPTHDFMQRFAAGLAEAQSAFSIVLSGGDTDQRPGPMTITITAVGESPTGIRLTRDRARPGDAIFVTGTLGDAACGLKLRRDDADARGWPLSATEKASLVARYRRPEPRLAAGGLLRSYATAAMDLSDGLAKDLGRLAAAARTGAVVDAARLPVSGPVARLAAAVPATFDLVLSGGDDYEVLFTAAPGNEDAIAAAASVGGLRVTRIGTMSEERGLRLSTPAGEHPMQSKGWDHF
jgi:thiamine-monophosphate kinase